MVDLWSGFLEDSVKAVCGHPALRLAEGPRRPPNLPVWSYYDSIPVFIPDRDGCELCAGQYRSRRGAGKKGLGRSGKKSSSLLPRATRRDPMNSGVNDSAYHYLLPLAPPLFRVASAREGC